MNQQDQDTRLHIRTAQLTMAVRLAVSTKMARRIYYEPAPCEANPKRMRWMCRLASEAQPYMSQLYAHVTSEGEVLHSYNHIIHPFVGEPAAGFCKVCKLMRSDRIHVNAIVSIPEFLRWEHPSGPLEIPIDQLYGPANRASDGFESPHGGA